MARPTSVTLGVAGDFSAFNSGLQRAIQSAQRTMSSAKFTSPLGTISSDARDFEKSLQAASQRVIAFSASLGSLSAVALVFKTIVKDTIAIEQAFIDINSVFQLSSTNLQKFSKDLFDVARHTSQGFEVATEAAKEFSRQGLDSAETLKRVRDALILTRASGLDVSKSVETLTATINSFNNASVDSTRIINKLVAVDQSFAVSARDLAEALSRVGSTAQDAGVSFDQLIGLVTAAQQTTARGGSVIGNSLKTIFTRIGRADTLQQLEDLNVEVRDLQGNALPAIEVMTNLAKGFDRLGEAAKSQAAELVGGVFQINVLRSVLKDLGKEQGIAAQATRVSSVAVDEAIKRNDALNKSLQSLLTQTQLTAKEIGSTIGQITFSDKLKGVIKILNDNPIVDSFKNINVADSGLRYGEDVGGNIAEGILSGIGNVLTGPALFYTIKILSGVAAQTFKIFGGDLLQLAKINKESGKQEALTKQINSLYETGNTILQRQLATSRAITAEMSKMGGVSAPRSSYSSAGPTPGSGFTSFAPHIFASSALATASPLAPRGMINDAIRGARTTPFDKTFTDSVKREMSEGGKNLAESLNYAYAEFSRIGISSVQLDAAIKRTVRGLDSYETQLRTNQENAKHARSLAAAKSIMEGGTPLTRGSAAFRAVGRQAEAESTAMYLQSIGKTDSDVLSKRERASLAAVTARARRIAETVATGPQLDPFMALQQGSGGFFGGFRAKGVAEEIIRSRNLSGTGARSLREAALLRQSQSASTARFGASFALPFAAGFIPEGAGGTGSGQALAAAGGALQGAGMGAALNFGPQGMIGAAIIGVGVGLVGKLRQSFGELAKQIEDSNAKNIELLNQTTGFNRLGESLRGAASGGASARDISILSSQQRDVFSSITDPKIKRQLLAASGDANAEQDVFLKLSREIGLQGSARDVASAIKTGNDSRGMFGKFFGGSSSDKNFGQLATAIQVSLQKGVDANGPEFKTKVQDAFKSDPTSALRLLGVNETEFPELFKELGVAMKDITFALSYAADNMVELTDGTIIAKEKQANFSREISRIVQLMQYEAKSGQAQLANSAEINKLITGASIDIIGGSPDSLVDRRGMAQLQNIRASGGAQLAGGVGAARANLLSLGAEKGQSNNFLIATLQASSEESFAALEKLAENSEVKKAIRDAVFELRSIKDNTRLELEKTAALIEITKIQTEIEGRGKILSGARYNEDTLQRFFDARMSGKSGLGTSPNASRANALLQQGDILSSLGFSSTDNTKNIRETLSILSNMGMITKLVSDITGDVLSPSDIGGVRDSARRGIAARSGKNLTEATEIDQLTQILDGLKRIMTNQTPMMSRTPQGQALRLSQYGNRGTGVLKDSSFAELGIGANRGMGVLKRNPTITSEAEFLDYISDANTSFDNRSGSEMSRANMALRRQQEMLRQRLFENAPISALKSQRGRYKDTGDEGDFDKKIRGFLSGKLEGALPGNVGAGDYGYTENPAKSPIVNAILESIKKGDTAEMLKSATSPEGKIFNLVKNNSDVSPEQISALMQSLITVAAKEFAIKFLFEGYKDAEKEISIGGSTKVPSNLRPNFKSKAFPQLNDFYSQSFTGTMGIGGTPSPSISPSFSAPENLASPQNAIRIALEENARKEGELRGKDGLIGAIISGDIEKELMLRRQIRDVMRETAYLSGLLATESEKHTAATQKELYIAKQISAAWDKVRQNNEDMSKGVLMSGSQLESDFFNAAKTEGMSGNSIGSFKAGFESPFVRMQKDLRDFSETGAAVAQSLERNFSDAFGNFAIGAMKGKDAFRTFVVSVLQDSSRAFASKAVQGLLGMLMGPGGGLSFNTSPEPRASGGIMSRAPALLTAGEIVVPKKDAINIGYDTLSKMNSGAIETHAFGGVVRGGSGVRDDVFKMLTPGDYVIKKSSVQKYGSENLLDMVKSGRVQKKFVGGMLLGGLLGGAMGYASGGKKGAIKGALIGGIGGGLFQNYSQTGNAFKGLSNGSMFSFSGSSAFKNNPLVTQLLMAGALGAATGLLSPKQKNNSDVLPTLSLGETEALRQNIEGQESRNLSKGGPGHLVPVQTPDGFIVYERGLVPATRRYAQGGIAGSSGSIVSSRSDYAGSRGSIAGSQGIVVGSRSEYLASQGSIVSPTLGAQLNLMQGQSSSMQGSMSPYAGAPIQMGRASYAGVPSLTTSGEVVVPREIVQSAGLRTFSEGGLAGSPSINMNPSSSNGATWNGDINITINKDGSMQEENSANRNDGSNLDNMANNIRGAVMEVLNEQTRTGGVLYQAYGTSRLTR